MKKIIISRTDSIGDVVLTLPLAGAIKKYYPDSRIYFLVKSYVKPIANLSDNIDEIILLDEIEKRSPCDQIKYLSKFEADAIIHVFPSKLIARLSKKAGIPLRIGTNHRTYHWFNCNKLISLGRKNSSLHEAQLNMKLIQPLEIEHDFSLSEIPELYGISRKETASTKSLDIISSNKANIILHPTSRGSAREWGLQNFKQLINLIGNKANVIITGSKEDRPLLSPFLEDNKSRIKDAVGKFSLEDLITLIAKAQILVAASTGPLHIAAALGIKAIGIYPPMRPIHPGRWAPLGKNAEVLVVDKACNDCKNSDYCQCMQDITPVMVAEKISPIINLRE